MAKNLVILSEDVSGPDVVQRRAAIELTEELREKLESQGIAREHQSDDLTLVKARRNLDRGKMIYELDSENKPTKKKALQKVWDLINNYRRNQGVILHYIGAGRRGTGDWCFEDGFITFRDLANLYLQRLRGHVLIIHTDCSYSGSLVRECMTFLDEQGVGPCGHSARDKGILIKVYASCLSHQVPRKLAYSVHGYKNDIEKGSFSTKQWPSITLDSKIAEAQHARGIDCTEVRCDRHCKSIDEECLCMPKATWHKWNVRVHAVNGEDGGRRLWHMVHLVDDDHTIVWFLEKMHREEREHIDWHDYGKIIKSGWGEEIPLEELIKWRSIGQSGAYSHKVYENTN